MVCIEVVRYDYQFDTVELRPTLVRTDDIPITYQRGIRNRAAYVKCEFVSKIELNNYLGSGALRLIL